MILQGEIMNTPEELKYEKTDEWVKVTGNKAKIGISDFAQNQLSDIVFIEFNKEIGESIKKGEVIATIESVKAAADVNAPVSGKVISVNKGIIETPEILNDDPYEKGWLFEVELENPSEVNNLFDADGYDKYCESRD